MKKDVGIVKEVYLKDEYESYIGFKILVNNELIDLFLKQDDDNVRIYKNDKVYIFFDIVLGKVNYSIKLLEEDVYE